MHRHTPRLMALLAVATLALSLLSVKPAFAATFVVDSAGDGADTNLADGVCAATGGVCTLRAAIQQANATVGVDTINFNIPGTGVRTLQPGIPLPTITQPVIINGYSQPGSAQAVGSTRATLLIQLSGANAGVGAYGLTLTGGGSTVSGLIINRFNGGGIRLTTAGGNTITGNHIGVDANGSTALPNGVGVRIEIENNTIGGTTPGARNVISGNTGAGIDIFSGTSNIIAGNYIGVNGNGNGALGNGGSGITITGALSTIGGTVAGARNIISANTPHGINVSGVAAINNQILGNYIGTDVTGTLDLGNTNHGVNLDNAPNNTVGGAAANAGNVISGNNAHGVRINLATGNTLQGNFIGMNAAGTAALGNSANGVRIDNGSNNSIGGTLAGTRNVISGNTGEGIKIEGVNATGNTVQGNFIGTNLAGTAAFPNKDGIKIDAGSSNTIGGTTADVRNIISGNTDSGIVIQGGSSNTIQGNYIGTTLTGAAALGNGKEGIKIDGSNSNTIGSTDPGASNLISGNGRSGIYIDGRLAVATSNTIQGNLIGTAAGGTAALGNAEHGVKIESASNTLVGGNVVGARNVISGNTLNGVYIVFTSGNPAFNNIVQGNFIGTTLAGTVGLPNGGHGVAIENGAQNNSVGGAGTGAGNTIAFNALDGVWISGANSTANLIQGNAIFSNTGLGIDLEPNNVTPNDAGDSDSGPNALQNYPVLTTAVPRGPNLRVTGTLNSAALATYRIDFYASTVCDPSSFGEGQFYLGFANTTTDGTGNSSFAASVNKPPAGATLITATATDPSNNTSEFSVCIAVRPDTIGVYRPSVTRFFLRNSNTTGPADINFVFGQTADLPVAGDWNGDGVDTVGLFRPSTGEFLLKDSNSAAAPVVYSFALGAPGDLPVAGDWDGDGKDSVGVFRPSTARFLLRNLLSAGPFDYQVVLGTSTDLPTAGDWNGDGIDSPGLYRSSIARFFLTDTLCALCVAPVNYQFTLGVANDVPLAGDWNADGVSGAGVFRPSNGRTFLRNALTTGVADITIVYGIAGDLPTAGRWIPSAGSAPDTAPIFEPPR